MPRRLLKVDIGDASAADKLFDTLMGEGVEAAARFYQGQRSEGGQYRYLMQWMRPTRCYAKIRCRLLNT